MTWFQWYFVLGPTIWVLGMFCIAICRSADRGDQQTTDTPCPASCPCQTQLADAPSPTD